MSAGQAVAMILLVFQMYRVNPAVGECVSWHESRHLETARNGIHQGMFQYNPRTFGWFLEMALEDNFFMHAHLFKYPDPYDPLQAITLSAWAIKNGYEGHWEAYKFCWDIQPVIMNGIAP